MKLKLRKGEAWTEARLDSLGAANCGDVCGSPSAPDYSGIAAANEKSAELARQAADNQLAFSKEQYDFLKPYIQQQLETGQQVSDLQVQAANQANDRTGQQWELYQTTSQPIEEKMAHEAMDYGSQADQEQAANQETDAAEAAARASAMTTGRQAIRDKGVSLRAGAVAFGRNQTNTTVQQVGLSTNSRSAATQSTGAGIGSSLAAGGQVADGYGAQVGTQAAAIQDLARKAERQEATTEELTARLAHLITGSGYALKGAERHG